MRMREYRLVDHYTAYGNAKYHNFGHKIKPRSFLRSESSLLDKKFADDGRNLIKHGGLCGVTAEPR